MDQENYFEPNHRLRSLFQDVEINPQYPLIRYFRSGPEMISMAHIYEKEGDIERAFMLYYKYITLFLEKLPTYPQYKTIPASEKNNVKHVLKEILPKAEDLKLKVLKKYTEEYTNLINNQKEVEESIKKEMEECELKKQTKLKELSNLNKADNLPLEKSKILNFKLPNSTQCENDIDIDSDNLPFQKLYETSYSPIISKSEKTIPVVPSRSLKPKDSYNNCINDNDWDGSAKLRSVRIPKNLVIIFLSMAESNTEKNIETGGHLFGKLSQNVFTITHLVIPKQSGKSDSFSAINEEEMVDFKEAKNLLTLGWIHTHPSQTAFLSSVDLHNQFPNQQLLPEYIAIVCAPTHDQTKIFTITPDYGMNVLATCKETGFHYHSQDPPLYQECTHVVMEAHLDVAVEDLRKKR